MDFYYDVIDWVAGYTYECATTAEVNRLLRGLGFRLERIIPGPVPIGCNEFVFEYAQPEKLTELRMQPVASLERASRIAAATQ